ncbi:MAG: hypothetical protein QOE92_347 [Chloroflexota bacterium]|jgi:putative NADH-flavin reductase|nr:hypothetical protein [Chloroflexota bacterium]
MKLLLLGATGGTGQQLVRQALAAGNDVTALVRNPAKLSLEDPYLVIRVGSVMDSAAVDEAVAGQDAVLSTLGVNDPRELLRASLMADCMAAVIPAMERHHVDRVIVLSALGVGASAPMAPPLLRIVFGTALRQVARDKAAAEAALRASNLNWTTVYAPPLGNGQATGQYQAGEHLRVRGLGKVSRADLAGFMLAQIDDTTFSRRMAILTA